MLGRFPLEGAVIARRPFLATVLIPGLTLTKFLRTIFVFLRFQPESIRNNPLVLPLFALGLAYWGVGFVQGAFKDRHLNRLEYLED